MFARIILKYYNCSNIMPVYPITFSIPESKIVDTIPIKTKVLSSLMPSLIPGNASSYIYNTEKDYYNEYKSSLFATTFKKGGWDCMRHYEILACGAIPYFPNIENCPINTLALLPKDLIKHGNTLYNKYAKTPISEIDMTECNFLIKSLLEYTRNTLTTKKMAQYILDKTNNSNVKRILFLSGSTEADYLRCVTLHGFKELLGSECHDYPMIPHIYKSNSINYSKLYGKGITYSNLLDSTLHDSSLDICIESDIVNHTYDLIIYGSYHRGMPFYNKVMSNYSPDTVILLCGEDDHSCNYNVYVERGHHVFVREL